MDRVAPACTPQIPNTHQLSIGRPLGVAAGVNTTRAIAREGSPAARGVPRRANLPSRMGKGLPLPEVEVLKHRGGGKARRG